MATSGYQGIPIAVNVKMQSVIHDTYTVSFDTPAFATLDHGSFTFTPANWNVNQVLTVICNAPGVCEIPVSITAPYRFGQIKRTTIDIDITPLPVDVWVGSTPRLDTNAGDGDLAISHNNLVAGNVAIVGVTSGTVSGYTYDTPFNIVTGTTIKVTKPDGTHVVITGSGALSYSMTTVGVYKFQPIQAFALILQGDVVGHTIQQQDFEFTVQTSGGGPVLATVSAGGIKSQGVSYTSTAFDYMDPVPVIIGNSAPDKTFPIIGALDSTFIGSLTFRDLGHFTTSNCSGGSASVAGDTITISGLVCGVSAGVAWQGTWTYPTSSGGFVPQLDGINLCADNLAVGVVVRGTGA